MLVCLSIEVRGVCGRLREGKVVGAYEPSSGGQLQKAAKRDLHRALRARRRKSLSLTAATNHLKFTSFYSYFALLTLQLK